MRRLLYGLFVALVSVAVLVGFMFFGFWGLLVPLLVLALACTGGPAQPWLPRPSPDR